jgi:hypothetical protein
MALRRLQQSARRQASCRMKRRTTEVVLLSAPSEGGSLHDRQHALLCGWQVRETFKTGRLHLGVASSWLGSVEVGEPLGVSVFVRSSTFRMPADPAAPLVLVGPGTGLAPFRGFLQARTSRIAHFPDFPLSVSSPSLAASGMVTLEARLFTTASSDQRRTRPPLFSTRAWSPTGLLD